MPCQPSASATPEPQATAVAASQERAIQDGKRLSIILLGGFRLAWDERPFTPAWRTQKAASLVKLLALAPGHRLHRDQLLDALWPDLDPAAAQNNFYFALHAARRALLADRSLLALKQQIVTLAPPERVVVDVVAFEAACDSARRSGDPAVYAAALARYAGTLLPDDHYDDWVVARRDQLQRAYLELLAEVARLHMAQREWPLAVAALEKVLEHESADEEAHTMLMRIRAMVGQRGLALRQFAALCDALRREVGAEPAATSRELHDAILTGRFPEAREDHPASRAAIHAEAPDTAIGRGNLPALFTSFIGREREVSALLDLLDPARNGPRLVTLIGPGGVGKTRLAVAVAERLQSAHPDGVWFIDFAAVDDPRQVSRAVGTVLGLDAASGRPESGVLVESLRSQRMLLIFDNCEHLVDACARLAAELLSGCPAVRILATSRELLAISGELTWRVSSLSVPTLATDDAGDHRLATLEQSESGQLLRDRVRLRWPAFAFDASSATAAIAICRDLGGIPLAIELVAVRAAHLSLEQIAARLGDTLALLGDGGRGIPARHRTLRATIDWSVRLLEPPERELFARLAVFAGGWTLDAAEAICADTVFTAGAILAALTRLVDCSLVMIEIANGEARYQMLEPIRQYASGLLAQQSTVAQQVAARHAAYFLSRSEPPDPDSPTWTERGGRERHNVRLARLWASTH